jgi:hypothetical protein
LDGDTFYLIALSVRRPASTSAPLLSHTSKPRCFAFREQSGPRAGEVSLEVSEIPIGVPRGVSKGVEDGRRLHALQGATPETTVSGVAR